MKGRSQGDAAMRQTIANTTQKMVRCRAATSGMAQTFGRHLHHEQAPEPPLVLDVDALGSVGGIGARPVLRTALQNACRARRKARHRCCPRATTTYDGTPAPLACGPWPSSRCPKPHSVCALNTCVGVLRGFLHRGLCDTCPQVGGRSSLGGVPGSYLTTLNRSRPCLLGGNSAAIAVLQASALNW